MFLNEILCLLTPSDCLLKLMWLSSHIDLKSIVLIHGLSVNLARCVNVLCVLCHGLPLTQLPHKPARLVLINTTKTSSLRAVLATIVLCNAE